MTKLLLKLSVKKSFNIMCNSYTNKRFEARKPFLKLTCFFFFFLIKTSFIYFRES